MTTDDLDVCIVEAKRFLERARAAKKRLEEDRFACIAGSKETGAVKRSSLDLTRALFDLDGVGVYT